MAQVVLTGGSGKLGRACLSELLEHGYSVTNVDLVRPADDLCPFVRADLADMGQTMEVLHQVDDRHRGVDAVVHLAAIPAPGSARDQSYSATIPSALITSSRRHGISPSITSCQPRAKRSWAYPSTFRHLMFPSTRNTRPSPSRRMRWLRPWERKWHVISAAGSPI